MLIDRRSELTRARVQTVNRLNRPPGRAYPGKTKKNITTGQAKTILASVRPRDLAGFWAERWSPQEGSGTHVGVSAVHAPAQSRPERPPNLLIRGYRFHRVQSWHSVVKLTMPMATAPRSVVDHNRDNPALVVQDLPPEASGAPPRRHPPRGVVPSRETRATVVSVGDIGNTRDEEILIGNHL